MSDQLSAALEAIESTPSGEDGAIQLATARGLLRGYDARWSGADWRVVRVETEYRLPVVNPDTSKPSRTFTHAGKEDAIAEFEGRRYLIEHKSCSEDISDPNATYWQRLEIDAQVSGYVLANWQKGEKLDGTCYDVIRKPGIRPKQLAIADRKEIIHSGTYFGQQVSEAARTAVAAGNIQEDAELFEIRLTADVLERPGWYYQRRSVPRMDSQLLDYARELWQTADEIRLARLLHRHYRNSGACMAFGRACTYLGICSGRDHTDSDRWVKKPQVHEELSSLDGDGRSVLTHSSMSTFKLCKRKFHHRYELGLERLDREDSDSLVMGKLLHAGLAAFWAALPAAESTVSVPVSQPSLERSAP